MALSNMIPSNVVEVKQGETQAAITEATTLGTQERNDIDYTLKRILAELIKMNIHLQAITGERILDDDVDALE